MCKNANIRKYIDEHDALKKDVENRYDIHSKRIFETNDEFYFVSLCLSYRIALAQPLIFYLEAAFTITEKSLAFKEAPPISPPSTCSFASSSSALPAFIEPPYCTTKASAAAWPYS